MERTLDGPCIEKPIQTEQVWEESLNEYIFTFEQKQCHRCTIHDSSTRIILFCTINTTVRASVLHACHCVYDCTRWYLVYKRNTRNHEHVENMLTWTDRYTLIRAQWNTASVSRVSPPILGAHTQHVYTCMYICTSCNTNERYHSLQDYSAHT